MKRENDQSRVHFFKIFNCINNTTCFGTVVIDKFGDPGGILGLKLLEDKLSSSTAVLLLASIGRDDFVEQTKITNEFVSARWISFTMYRRPVIVQT